MKDRNTGEPAARSVLVVGGDGVIGSALVDALNTAGFVVTATTRRVHQNCASRLYLDLAQPETFNKFRICRFETAVLCGAITSVQECEHSPSATHKVNVEGTVALARILGASGTHLVFLSTSMVFDGSKPYPKAEDPTSPTTEYGRQKVVVERALLDGLLSVTIVRFTKIMQPSHPLVLEWLRRLRASLPIFPFLNRNVSPISISFAVEVLSRVISTQVRGIIHASADSEMSYADLAIKIAEEENISSEFVQPVNSCGISNCDVTCIHAALECGVEILGLSAPSPYAAISEMVMNSK